MQPGSWKAASGGPRSKGLGLGGTLNPKPRGDLAQKAWGYGGTLNPKPRGDLAQKAWG